MHGAKGMSIDFIVLACVRITNCGSRGDRQAGRHGTHTRTYYNQPSGSATSAEAGQCQHGRTSSVRHGKLIVSHVSSHAKKTLAVLPDTCITLPQNQRPSKFTSSSAPCDGIAVQLEPLVRVLIFFGGELKLIGPSASGRL